LTAISAKIATEKTAGGQLADLQWHLVKLTTTGYVPHYNPNWPALLVEPLPVSAEAISIPPCMWRKTLPIQYTIVFDQSGINGRGINDAVTLIDKVENVFMLQDFGLVQWVDLTSKDYNTPLPAPFTEPSAGAVSMIMTYTYIDIRALP
jgi:hypothetical protein